MSKRERLLVILVMLCIVAFAVYRHVAGRKAAQKLREIRDGAVLSIEFVSPSGGARRRVRLKDQEAVSGFEQALRTVRAYYPGQLAMGEQSTKWRVLIKKVDGWMIELDWIHRSKYPDEVVGKVVKTTELSPQRTLIENLGGFRSRQLRNWFDKYVAPEMLTDR